MNGLGQQALQISSNARFLNDFSIDHAVSAAPYFGMSKDEARQEWNRIAGWVGRRRDVFSECGVSGNDINYLGDFLGSPPNRLMSIHSKLSSPLRKRHILPRAERRRR
jgi:serine/threonine-protein kinase HipA